MTVNIDFEINTPQAFKVLCDTLSIALVEEPKFICNAHNELVVVNDKGELIDDRGELYLAVYHLATKVFMNTEFRAELDDPRKLMCKLYEQKEEH